MAFKRKRSSSRTTRRVRPRTRNTRKRLRIPRPLIVAATQFVTLRYTDVKNYDPAAGQTAANVYRATSLFDPDLTGLGQQPSGLDQWEAFYNKYYVYKSNIKVELLPTALDDETPQNRESLLQIHSTRSSTLTGYGDLIEARDMPRVRTKLISGGFAGPNGGVVILRNNFNMRRDFGHGMHGGNEALITASPTKNWYFHVHYANPFANGVNPGLVRVIVTITYHVKFMERKQNMFDS